MIDAAPVISRARAERLVYVLPSYAKVDSPTAILHVLPLYSRASTVPGAGRRESRGFGAAAFAGEGVVGAATSFGVGVLGAGAFLGAGFVVFGAGIFLGLLMVILGCAFGHSPAA